jgi:hypothetical protein
MLQQTLQKGGLVARIHVAATLETHSARRPACKRLLGLSSSSAATKSRDRDAIFNERSQVTIAVSTWF